MPIAHVFKVSKACYDINDENVKPSDAKKKMRVTLHMLHLLALDKTSVIGQPPKNPNLDISHLFEV